MGLTCSKNANEVALENRRMEREMRLGLTPISRRGSPQHSHSDSKTSLRHSLHALTQQDNLCIPTPQAISAPPRSRPLTPQRQCRTNQGSIPSSLLSRSPRSPQNISKGPHYLGVSGCHNLPCPPRRIPHAIKTSYQPPLVKLKKTPKVPPHSNGKHMISRSTETADSYVSHRVMKQPSARVESKSRMEEQRKTKVKPVLRRALNLLSVLEIQFRSEIVNDSIARFGNIEAEFEYMLSLENVRNAAFALFSLQTKSREAIIEQEVNERKILVYWMNQTLEEDRLEALIEATQRRHQASMSPSRSSVYQRSKQRESRRATKKGHESRKNNQHSSEERSSPPRAERVVDTQKNQSKSANYLERYHGRERYSQKGLPNSVFSYSTPRSVDKISPASLERDVDVPSDGALDSKIQRQTKMIQEVLPSYSQRSVSFSPIIRNVRKRDVLAEEDFKYSLQPSVFRPIRNVPKTPRRLEEDSPLRHVFQDIYYNTPLRDLSVSSKEASDLALKRRLSALLRA